MPSISVTALSHSPKTVDGSIWCPCQAFHGFCYHKAALGIHLGTIPPSWLPTPTAANNVLQVAS